MINHARTLLGNKSVAAGAFFDAAIVPDIFGGQDPLKREVIDPTFYPPTLPPSLQAVDRFLFGADYDIYRHTYRLRQLMAFLHSKKTWHGFLTDLDPRLSYDPREWATQPMWTPRGLNWVPVSPIPDIPSSVSLPSVRLGEYSLPPDAGGVCLRYWLLLATEGMALLFDVYPEQPSEPSVVGAKEDWLAIPNTPHQISALTLDDVPATCSLFFEARPPARSIAELAAMAESLSAEVIAEVVGRDQDREPFRSFQKMYADSERLTRFAGFLLAYIYRLEELTRG